MKRKVYRVYAFSLNSASISTVGLIVEILLGGCCCEAANAMQSMISLYAGMCRGG